MLIKDLIKILEHEYQKQLPNSEMMGEPSIEIDVFGYRNGNLSYLGFSPDIYITSSGCGTYRILTSFDVKGIDSDLAEKIKKEQEEILKKS